MTHCSIKRVDKGWNNSVFLNNSKKCRICSRNLSCGGDSAKQDHFNNHPEFAAFHGVIYAECGKNFFTKSEYLRHKCLVVKCSICGEMFDDVGDFRKHRNKNKGCKDRSERPNKAILLPFNQELRDNSLPNNCIYCMKRLPDPEKLAQHVRNCVENPDSPIFHDNEDKECQVCEQVFYRMKRYLPANEKDLPFTCFDCRRAVVKVKKDEPDDPFLNPHVQEVLNSHLNAEVSDSSTSENIKEEIKDEIKEEPLDPFSLPAVQEILNQEVLPAKRRRKNVNYRV